MEADSRVEESEGDKMQAENQKEEEEEEYEDAPVR